MDIQNFINSINENTRVTAGKEYNLRRLINDLEASDKEAEVIIDAGFFPLSSTFSYAEDGDEKGVCKYTGNYFKYNKEADGVFSSWRGSYNTLSMEYSGENKKLKVKSLLEMAKFINEKYLCGYKGGDFKMDGDTPIYIANYGESGVDLNGEYITLKLVGVNLKDNNIILVTRKEED